MINLLKNCALAYCVGAIVAAALRQAGVYNEVAAAISGLTVIIVVFCGGILAVILVIYATIIWPDEIMDSLRLRFGAKRRA
jgi:hypothetical protein